MQGLGLGCWVVGERVLWCVLVLLVSEEGRWEKKREERTSLGWVLMVSDIWSRPASFMMFRYYRNFKSIKTERVTLARNNHTCSSVSSLTLSSMTPWTIASFTAVNENDSNTL